MQNTQGMARFIETSFTRRDIIKLAIGGTALGFGGALVRPSGYTLAQDTDLSGYPEITISAENADGGDYKFVVPDSAPSGYVKVTLENKSDAEHHAMFMRPNADVTADDFATKVRDSNSPADFAPLADAVGGPGSVSPGQSTSVVMNLDEGDYVIICEVPNDEGMPHYKMGMIEPLTVQATDNPVTTAPTAETTVDLVDFAFDGLPASMPTGQHIWEVHNTGPEPHEMIIEMLSPGITSEQAFAMLTAPETPASPEATDATPPAETSGPPFIAVAGSAPMNPGHTVWPILNLQTGDYVTVCFIPDPASGKPHIALGMFAEFTVE